MGEDKDTEFVHLWEPEHPYYCEERNRIIQGSWHEYFEEDEDGYVSTPDSDLNLIFRWDWQRKDYDEDSDRYVGGPGSTLILYIMMQRKGKFVTWEFDVRPEDEDSVRAFLKERWDKLVEMWEPISSEHLALAPQEGSS